MSGPTLSAGDVVKLGPTALEKHYVLHVWADDTVQLRQCTTGKIRNVQARRCVLVSDKRVAS